MSWSWMFELPPWKIIDSEVIWSDFKVFMVLEPLSPNGLQPPEFSYRWKDLCPHLSCLLAARHALNMLCLGDTALPGSRFRGFGGYYKRQELGKSCCMGKNPFILQELWWIQPKTFLGLDTSVAQDLLITYKLCWLCQKTQTCFTLTSSDPD